MTEDYQNSRYERFVSLPNVGIKGMAKIRNSHITVVGAGGLGSVSAIQLTTLGVGHLRLIDDDLVEENNLQRQILYRQKDIGKPKVVAARKFLENLNPEVEIEVIQEKIDEKNASIAVTDTDIIVDALDKFEPRLALNRECLKQNKPFLFGAVTGLTGNTMTVTRETTCLECLYGHIDDSKLPSTRETGIHPAIINIIGNLQIAEATKIMLDEKPSLLNRLLFCDINTMEFESIFVRKNPICFCTKKNY